nr:M28 family peptidase [Gemmatimonadota bacterium]NIU36872.1 M28 family peptidase [Gemmatimonadota bacterium]NIV83794.1 M28 family peptidase [Gemmatimonadota bacterium]NIW65466.1 M28 family peptidase [Gemmatimonadota bacterium]
MALLPGKSYRGPLPPLSADQIRRRDILRREVEDLATGIGERHTGRPGSLERAADYLDERLRAVGWSPRRWCFETAGRTCCNLVVDSEATGPPLVVGAHYDTVPGSPGANDNATGIAV